MKFFPNPKTFLSIGNITIQWYAVIIVTGIVISYYIIKKDIKNIRSLERTDFYDDLFVYSLLMGILGARLWYCLFYPTNFYLVNPLEILKIWDGGLAIHGGLIVGGLTGIIICKKKKMSPLKIFDTILPTVLLAQGIGRWGNYVNQECHGPEVDSAYFDGILSFLKEGMYIDGHYYMPTFFYESIACIIGFILIRYLLRRTQTKRGEQFYSYCMWYGTVRLIIEHYRTDPLYLGSLKIAQIISIIGIVFGVLGYFGLFAKLFKNYKRPKPTIIFDYDSTLIDTKQSIYDGYRYLFKKYDKEENFTEKIKKEIDGPALAELFPKYFLNEDVEKLIEEYRVINAKSQEKTNKVIKNADIVLKTLKEEGYNVGIVSSRNKEGVLKGLKMFNLDKYVDDVFGIYEVAKLKPDPEGIREIITKNKWNRDEIVYVGDSKNDILSGLNYGAFTIAYHSNPQKDEDLNNSGANVQIYDMIQVLEELKKDHYFTYNLK